PGAPRRPTGDAAPGRPSDPRADPLPRPDHPQDRRRTEMNPIELDRTLRQLRLSGMADCLEMRLLQAQSEKLPPIDLLSALVGDELLRRQDRLLERRIKQAGFRDALKTLDSFDFDFNKKMDRRLCFE